MLLAIIHDAAFRSAIFIAGVYGAAMVFYLVALFFRHLLNWTGSITFLHWPVAVFYTFGGLIHELLHAVWCSGFSLKIQSAKEDEICAVINTRNPMHFVGSFFASLSPAITCLLPLLIVVKFLSPLWLVILLPPLSTIGTPSKADIVTSSIGVIPAFFFMFIIITVFRLVMNLI
jgi:hypothetical protein